MAKFFLFIFLFLFIYAPYFKFLPVNIIDVLSIGSLFYLIATKEIGNFLLFSLKKDIALIFFAMMVAYSLCLDVLIVGGIETNSHSILNIRLLLEGVIPAYTFLLLMRRFKMDFEDVLVFLAWASLLQVFIALCMFDIEFKKYIFFHILNIPEQSPLLISSIFTVRGYGLAKDYLFSFSLVQGLMVILCFYLGVKRNGLYFFIGMLSIIPVVLNARVGFLPIMIYLLVMIGFFFYKLLAGKIVGIKYLVFLAALLSLLFLTIHFGGESESKSLDRVEQGFSSVYKLLVYGEVDSHTALNDLLSEEFLRLPENSSDLLLGSGVVLGNDADHNSDIGYVRNIYYGGILYSLIVYLFFGILILGVIMRWGDHTASSISFLISLFVSIYIAQFKGNIFLIDDVTRLLFLFYIGQCILSPGLNSDVSSTETVSERTLHA